MNGGELFFILMVVTFLSLWLYKLTNVLTVGKLYDTLVSWLTFIGGVMAYGLGFLLNLSLAVDFLYVSVVFRFVTAFLVMFFILQFIEVVFVLASRVNMATGINKQRSKSFR